MTAPVNLTTLSRLEQQTAADPRYKAYQPYGSAIELLYGQDPEILICGPAGTGKSRAALEKMHLLACKYPNMRGLMVRKTRESLTQSAMVTFENFVIPDNGTVKFRTAQQEYRYVNGSKIVLGGMDKPSKIMSSEYDYIYGMEATELTLNDLDALITRNRYGIIPYQQIVLDCNPGPPAHWLNQRAKSEQTRRIRSVHKDNPRLWDHFRDCWTPGGEQYIAKLQQLTGVRRLRLYKGIWAAAEGMIYEEQWDEDVHRIPRQKFPKDWMRIWLMDFGYKHPICWQAWAIDPETTAAYRFAEIYQRGLLVEDAAAMILAWQIRTGEPNPYAFICDWNAEDRATLSRHLDMETVAADKSVLKGINAVKTRLRVDKNGRSELYFLRDSLLEIDYGLRDEGLPACTEDEIESYIWKNSILKEEPKKINDHGCDCMRYLCNYLDGENMGWTQGMTA